MALFYKPRDVSYQFMENFVNQWKIGGSKEKLYKYLYLLIKNYAKEKKMFSSAYEIEMYAEKASKLAYSDILSGKHPNYYGYNLSVDKKENAKIDEVKLIEENVLDKFKAFNFDVCNSKQVKRILSKLPKRNNSCESKNIELSILLSIINLKCGGKDVILFHTNALFKEYVRCIANLIYRSIGDIS